MTKMPFVPMFLEPFDEDIQSDAEQQPADSLILEPARPFTMPSKRFSFIESNGSLVAVLLCIMLSSCTLLVWFALVPRDNAGASPAQQVAEVVKERQDLDRQEDPGEEDKLERAREILAIE